MSDPLHRSVDDHLRPLLDQHGGHEPRSRALLTLAANYRARVLTEAVWRQTGGRVMAGPFAGLQLLDQASEGCLLPKLLGCYEAPLAAPLRALAESGLEVVINIGCAEGYYAVGLARLMPGVRIHAYDRDPQARALCARLAERNGVADRVEIGDAFTAADFAGFAGRRCLVLCDIEGDEWELLDPLQVPALAGFALVVELHDRPGRPVSARLPERFAATHDITLLSQRDRALALPPGLEGWREIDQLLAAWEMRAAPTPWGIFAPRQPAQPERLEELTARLPRSLDGELLTALDLAERIWRLAPTEDHWRQLWDLANRAGATVEACRAFLAAAPDQPLRRLALGNALRRAHCGSAAEAAYRQALGGADPALEAIVLGRLAILLLAQDRLDEADALFQRSAALHPGRVSAMRCSPAFFADLQAAPLPEPPPQLPDQPPGPRDRQDGLVVFAACDGVYLDRFVSALLNSASRNLGQPCAFHLHVLNPPADLAARLSHFNAVLGGPGISWTTERVEAGPDARTHYACARFRLLPHLLRRWRRPVLMLDADLIVLRPLGGLLAAMRGHDVGLVVTDRDGYEPWNWLWADVVLARPTAAAEAYFALVARYIDHFLHQGVAPWFLDQLALALCRTAAPPRLLRLPRDLHRLELNYADGQDLAPPDTVLFWSAHASILDPALTLGMARYRDYLLPWP